MNNALTELERIVHAALETDSNVHRGAGHHSMISTRSYKRAGEIVPKLMGLSGTRCEIIICSPRRAALLGAQLRLGSYTCCSSADLGPPLGGGTARLVAPGWVVWARAPDRFEPGTPATASLGIENTGQDVDALIAALAQIAGDKPGRASELNGRLDRFVAAAAERVYEGG